MTDTKTVDRIAKLFQAIGEVNRLRIVEVLWDGPKNVTEISKQLGIKIVNVSHHLSVLKDAGLVQDEKRGRFVLYTLHPEYHRPASETTNAMLDLGWCKVTPTK